MTSRSASVTDILKTVEVKLTGHDQEKCKLK